MNERSTDKTLTGAGLEQLAEGYEFSPVSYELSKSAISKYLEAVAGQEGYPFPDFVPPMFVAARSLGVLSGLISLLAGTIHTSQELEFLELVPVGATIECHGRVVRKLQRGGLRLLVIGLSAFNQDKEQVLAGKTTLVLPG
ncbi:MAG: MaoC family dehydratase [Dehalococcoidales bacterium]|nr:MaoC family dehydratase [Dehalococcoidales bacterium]